VTAARYPGGTERRAAPAAELRAGSGRTLAGYAAVWDSPARIGGVFDELVRRGAFTASLASRADVFLLAHHDFSQPLARTGNASLQLREDARGLAFEAALPETRSADDVLALARSGTLAGAPFAFRVPDGDRWPTRDRRELIRVDLIEVSAVAQPACAATTISARRDGASVGLRRSGGPAPAPAPSGGGGGTGGTGL
jgi:HK97 family phage prohead protease